MGEKCANSGLGYISHISPIHLLGEERFGLATSYLRDRDLLKGEGELDSETLDN